MEKPFHELIKEPMTDSNALRQRQAMEDSMNKAPEVISHLVKEKQIKDAVDRFLMWKLPEDFSPDCGIEFDAEKYKKINPKNARCEPIGTNLFTATQAEAMVRFILSEQPHD